VGCNLLKLLFKPSLAQAIHEMIGRCRIFEQPPYEALPAGTVDSPQLLEVPQRSCCLLHAAELGEAGDDIRKTGRPVAIKPPRPLPDLHGLLVISELVVGAGQGGKRDEQARISEVETDRSFDDRDGFFRATCLGEQVSEGSMRGGKAGVEFNRSMHLSDSLVVAMRVHAGGAEGPVCRRIAGVKANRAFGQAGRFLVIAFSAVRPVKKPGVEDRDR